MESRPAGILVWAAKLNCRWSLSSRLKSLQSNLGGTREHRQLKHSLTSFVLILFILSQPNMRWILAVQASANNVTVGIRQGIMAVRVGFLATPRLAAFITSC